MTYFLGLALLKRASVQPYKAGHGHAYLTVLTSYDLWNDGHYASLLRTDIPVHGHQITLTAYRK